jgi:hypothetical protein
MGRRGEDTPPESPETSVGEEIKRRDAEIRRLKEQLASLERRLPDKIELVPLDGTESATSELASATDGSLRERCDLLEGENKRLRQSNQALEQTIAELRTELDDAK